MKLGAHALPSAVFVAPMAGITDRPFRRLARRCGAALAVSVTVKFRPGPSPERRNAVRIARLVECAGAQMLAIHGRTRACMFEGEAEYDTIAEVKSRLRIPVIANGDISTPQEAKR